MRQPMDSSTAVAQEKAERDVILRLGGSLRHAPLRQLEYGDYS